MEKRSRIYVAGHTGLLGSAIVRALRNHGFINIIVKDKVSFDLTNERETEALFDKEGPEYVFLCAAKVGGIADNINYPFDYLVTNVRIAFNVITSARLFGVKKLLFYGSNCMYPRECMQPMREEYLMTGSPEPTSRPFEIAKLAGLELCRSSNIQHKTNFIMAVPASIYGENDHFEIGRGHVLPSLITKFHRAKVLNEPVVVLWGDGSPLREFIYVDDVAEASIFLMENFTPLRTHVEKGDIFLNIGSDEEISMFDLALLVASIIGYGGKISWDTSRPNGMPRKLLDSSQMNAMGWKHKINLREGIEKTYQWYLKNSKSDS